MATNSDPVFSSKSVTTRTQAITASSSSSGNAVTHTEATTFVEISNIFSTLWPMEYSLGGAAWVSIAVGKKASLSTNLATTALAIRRSANAPASVDVSITFEGVPSGLFASAEAITPPSVSVARITDASSLTLTTAHADTGRIPSGTLTYTIDASTGWDVSDGMSVWLPASGTISFAVSGGPTINGGTSTLTRTLAGNSLGYVVLSCIAGTNAYSLSGA